MAAGAHALFFPHGLGHMMGLDVHDMEDLRREPRRLRREDPSAASSSAWPTCAWPRSSSPGHVLTVEPGHLFHPGPDRPVAGGKEAPRLHRLRRGREVPRLRRRPHRGRRPGHGEGRAGSSARPSRRRSPRSKRPAGLEDRARPAARDRRPGREPGPGRGRASSRPPRPGRTSSLSPSWPSPGSTRRSRRRPAAGAGRDGPGPDDRPVLRPGPERRARSRVLNLFERDGDRTYDSSPVIDADGRIARRHPDGPHHGGPRIPRARLLRARRPGRASSTGPRRAGSASPSATTAISPNTCAACDRPGPSSSSCPRPGRSGSGPRASSRPSSRWPPSRTATYAALVNRVGREDGLEFAGESFVVDPDGRVIARAPRGRDHILYADCDLARNASSPRPGTSSRTAGPGLRQPWDSRTRERKGR
ncbi:MAG: M24 family metallopeptidase [Desulfobacterales bacterium]|nr:M24 family metallopeptidase [Desulfobacterales bacterium]